MQSVLCKRRNLFIRIPVLYFLLDLAKKTETEAVTGRKHITAGADCNLKNG